MRGSWQEESKKHFCTPPFECNKSLMHEFCAKDKSTNAKAKIYAKLESNGTVGWSENLKTVLET